MPTLRIAAAQLDFHAAFEGGGAQALREPNGAWEGRGLAGLRTGDRELDAKLRRLREQIERTYLDAFQPRLEAVIRFCQELETDLLVLPEYAIPLTLLPAVVAAAGPKMTVVAGTHTVTTDGWRRSNIYERLGLSGTDAKPVIGSAVAPVLKNGLALALQPKLSASRHEPDLIPGERWAPVPLGQVRLGVFSGLDFRKLRDAHVGALVAGGLDECAVLAVPSLTLLSALASVDLNIEEMLSGFAQPIAYATHAQEGGTRIVTPESPPPVILAAGRPPSLPPRTEGVIIADVQLAETPRTRRPVTSRTVAAAVLMDARPFRELKAAAAQILAAPSVAEAFDHIEREEGVLRSAAENPKLPEVARARWRYLAEGAQGAPRIEHLRALVRDIWIDGAVSPEALERGLIEGALRVLRDVERHKPDAAEIAAVRASLEQDVAGRHPTSPASPAVIEQVTEGLLDAHEPPPPPPPPTRRGADGSFERWMKDPGELPERLRLEGFESWPGDELVNTELRKVRDPDRIADTERAAARERIPFKEINKIAGLLALWGHPPAWFGLLNGTTPALVLRDGRVVFYTPAAPSADLLRMAAAARALGAGPASAGPRSLRLDSIPLAVIDDPVAPPPGVRVLSRELRALARNEPHLSALADFRTSPEGERFVEPEARLRGGAVDDAGEHLRAFQESPHSLCLLVGDFGSGKSTTTRTFAAVMALDALHRDGRPPIFIDLRAWSGSLDLADLVRRALGVADVAPVRFAVECGECVLIIDGFDELESRLSPAQLASAFQRLLAWHTKESKVLLTCPLHLFPGPSDMEAKLRTHSFGEVPDAMVLELLPFDEERIRYYLERVAFDAADAEQAWTVLNKVTDLKIMARRPLLLNIIRSTLPVLLGAEKVAIGDLYESYVQLWSVFAGTQQRLSPDERIEFTEILARCIWRGDKGVEGDSVHASVLFGPESAELPEPLRRKVASDAAAQLEIRAGAFVVFHDAEGGGFYRLSHRSFLEYLVARLAVRRLAQGDREAIDLPRFTPEVIDYCLMRPEWERARSTLQAALCEGYRGRISENALLLAHADGGFGSTRDRPFRLEGAELTEMDLEEAELSFAWLGGAELSDAKLARANLAEARLDGALLQGADLRGADLHDASLHGARAQGARLDGARLQGADLREARLEGSSAFEQAPDLDGALLDGAKVAGAAWCEPASGVALRALKGVADARFRSNGPLAEGGMPDASPSIIEFAGHRGRLTGVAFSPDGSHLATACNDGAARIWEAQTGRLLVTLQGHQHAVTAVAFSPDGARIATASWDKTARIWEAQTGRLLITLQAHREMVAAVAFSPDGARIATASWDKTARIWEAQTGRLLITLQGHMSYVTTAAFSPDSARLVTASFDRTAKVWEAQTGQPLFTLQGHTTHVLAALFSPDGEHLVTAPFERTVGLWDAATGRHLFTHPARPFYINALAISPDGARIATGHYDGTAKIWEATTGRLLATFAGHTGALSGIAFSADGTRLATASYDKTAAIWEAQTGRRLVTLPGHVDAVSAVALSADGARIAAAMEDATTRVWGTRAGRFLLTLRGHTGPIRAMAFSPEGARIATASHDKTARIWDAKSGELLRALHGHTGAILAVTFTADGRRVATVSQDNTAQLWEAQTGQLLLTIRSPTGSIHTAAFSADGSYLLAVSKPGAARIWATSRTQFELLLRAERGSVTSVALSADGARLAIASDDHTTRLWDAKTGRRLATFEGHAGAIRAVAFSPDGARLATASADHTARLWDVATGRLLTTFEGHASSVIAVAFSPEGTCLITAARDHTVRIWDASSGRARATFLHVSEGGMVASDGYCLPSGTADLDLFTVRTGARCAPLALYHDLCVRPDLVAASLAGEAIPALSIPMDLAERRVSDPPPPQAEAPVPPDLMGPALVAALATFAARRDLRLAEHTLARCAARIEGVLRAGSPGSLVIVWSLPGGLDRAPGFSRSAKVLLAKETEQRPLDLGDLDVVTIPASAPGRVAVSITFFLDGAERTLELSVTAFAKNPYIVGSPIIDPRDFYGRVGLVDQILGALEDDSVAIRGEIRIGKTSLLHQLARAAGPSAEMVSLQQYAGRFPRFLPDLARRLAPSRDDEGRDGYEAVDDAVTRRLEAAPVVGRRAKLILILDEVQFLAREWDFRHQLRALLQARKVDGLRAVIAGPGSGLRALAADNDASAFLNMFQPYYLEPMRPDEITRLVRAPLGPEIIITDAAVARVITLSGGRPLVAQILCRHALDRVRQQEGDRIDEGTIDRVLDEAAFHDIVHNFYAYPARWADLPEEVRRTLKRIAALPPLEQPDLDRATLRLLAEHDLADAHQRKLYVEPTFLLWIQEEAP